MAVGTSLRGQMTFLSRVGGLSLDHYLVSHSWPYNCLMSGIFRVHHRQPVLLQFPILRTCMPAVNALPAPRGEVAGVWDVCERERVSK